MVPAAVVCLPEFPLTPNKKIDTKALPAPTTTVDHHDRAQHEPRDEIEREIARFWSQLLARDGIGIHEHFFRLGGHSLQVMRVIAHIRKTFGVSVPVAHLFEQPTIAAIADRVREAISER
jgi:acyl carrier protein